MRYSLTITIGRDGNPVVTSAIGSFPPAGHTITIAGRYEMPNVIEDRVVGQVSVNVQHYDASGDHVISAMQNHDRSFQGQTASDVKIVAQKMLEQKAIEEADAIEASHPYPPVGPDVHGQTGSKYADEGFL